VRLGSDVDDAGARHRAKGGDGDFVAHGVSVTRQPQTSTLVHAPGRSSLRARTAEQRTGRSGTIGLQVVAGTRAVGQVRGAGVGAPPPRALLSRGAGDAAPGAIRSALDAVVAAAQAIEQAGRLVQAVRAGPAVRTFEQSKRTRFFAAEQEQASARNRTRRHYHRL